MAFLCFLRYRRRMHWCLAKLIHKGNSREMREECLEISWVVLLSTERKTLIALKFGTVQPLSSMSSKSKLDNG